ncbi:zinc ribbon domain-containing protein [Leucobacter sp. GX24907]
MKASPRQQQLLLDLQELDTRGARLRRQRQQIPELDDYAALDEDHAAARARFMEAQRGLDSQQAELERIEADVRLVGDRRVRDEQLLAASTAAKEAQALQGELELLARRQNELEDRQLEAMETIEAAQVSFAEAEQSLAQIEGRRSELATTISSEQARIDAESARTSDEREGLAAELQRDVLELYEETRARTGLGAARLRGDVSEGSNMTLAPGELATIRAAAPDEIVFCPGSGAILVRVAE